MSEFQELVIENFQSHEHTVISFLPGLNVFVGPSDSGKSSILRALRWLLFNVPRGSDFVRTGAKECRVTLRFASGDEIVRMRGSSSNRYILRTKEGAENVFEGFGNEVPEEIVRIHGIRMLNFDGKEIVLHLGTQLESPFFLFETAGNKAKMIGRVSGAHLIDKALKKTSADRQNTNSEIKRIDHEIEELKEQLTAYDSLSQSELQMKKAENAFCTVKESKVKKESLQKIYHTLLTLREEKKGYQKWIGYKENMQSIDVLLGEIEDTKRKILQCASLLQKWRAVQHELAHCRKKLTKKKDIVGVEDIYTAMCKKQHHYTVLEKMHLTWQSLKLEKEKIRRLLEKKEDMAIVEDAVTRLCEKKERAVRVSGVYTRLMVLQKEKRGVQEILCAVDRTREVVGVLRKVTNQYDRYQRVHGTYEKWRDLRWRLDKGRRFKGEKEKEIAYFLAKWVEALKKLKSCPTCGTNLDSIGMEHVLSEYQEANYGVAIGREDSDD